MVKAATVAGVAGAAVLAGATPAMALAASVGANHMTNLVDGQHLTVLFDDGITYNAATTVPSTIPVYVCTQTTFDATPGKCSQFGTLNLDRTGTFTRFTWVNPDIAIKQSWTYLAPNNTTQTQTCTTQCFLVSQVTLATGTLRASAPISFKAPK